MPTYNGERIVTGFLRSGKSFTATVTPTATGYLRLVSNTGDPQIFDLTGMRGKGAVKFGPIPGDVDVELYVLASSVDLAFAVNEFLVESNRSVTNGVVEQPAGGGGGPVTPTDVLSSGQTAGGGDSVIATNDQNELINKSGGRDFKATIVPRNMTLASLKTLVNGQGEIASSSDSHHIVKLFGAPGSGKVQFFHAMPDNYTFVDELSNGGYSFISGDGANTAAGHKFINYSAGQGGTTAPANWVDLTAMQKGTATAYTAISQGIFDGFGIHDTAGFYATGSMLKITIKTKYPVWNSGTNSWSRGAYNANAFGEYSVCDDSGNLFVRAWGQNDGLEPEVTIGAATNNMQTSVLGADIRVASAGTRLGIWGVTPVVQPTAAGLTAAGARVGTTGNAVMDASTFTGGLGTSAYTIPQIVKALKLLGVLAL